MSRRQGSIGAVEGAPRPTGGLNASERAYKFFGVYGLILIIVVLGAVFFATAPRFLLPQNLLNILKQISVVAIMAIGMYLVILIGGIDLSVGSSALLAAVVTMYLINHNYASTGVAIVAGLAAATAVGFLNGLMVERAGISPIIVTLGTMIAVRGLAQTILWIDNSWLWVKNPLLLSLVRGNVGFVPVLVLFMLALYAIFMLAANKTRFGRYLYAIGGNQRAAYLCGVPVVRVKTAAYTLSGLMAGVGGLILVARLSAVSPAVGNNIQFDVITAVVLGGASLSGGEGKIERTLLGALLAGMIVNYLTIKGIPGPYQSAVNGFIILAAVILDKLSKARA
jgi:ribose transport system permease protein